VVASKSRRLEKWLLKLAHQQQASGGGGAASTTTDDPSMAPHYRKMAVNRQVEQDFESKKRRRGPGVPAEALGLECDL
jgi:hypothetical protein